MVFANNPAEMCSNNSADNTKCAEKGCGKRVPEIGQKRASKKRVKLGIYDLREG